MLDLTTRTGADESVSLFRESVRKLFSRELHPNLDRWEAEGMVDRNFWLRCGEAGLLCPQVPIEYGGPGLDYRYNAVVDEELTYAGSCAGITLQSDITVGYLIAYGSETHKRNWLPKMVSGEVITAIAMTEPSAGSDLQAIRTTAIRDGDNYIINGSKTYITNGQTADLVIVAAKTGASTGSRGMSLILVEADRQGFKRGRKLDKIGQNAADTSELFFDDVRVPASNLLGQEGRGFAALMQNLPQERLQIAVKAQAGGQRAFDEAVKYTKQRPAFGGTIFDLQHTTFKLAELKAKLQAGWAHIDWCVERHIRGHLDAPQASAAKLYHTELQWEVVDAALQMHGGAGYMNETPIARLWRDARAQRIYGGTSEIMKLIIGRSI